MNKFGIVIVLSFVFCDFASAHSGRTNSSGCHNNRKTGGYHCHNSGSNSTTSFRKTYKKSINSRSIHNHDKVLVLKIQQALNHLGYNVGKADGIHGIKTSKAIREYQRDNNLIVTGNTSERLHSLMLKQIRN